MRRAPDWTVGWQGAALVMQDTLADRTSDTHKTIRKNGSWPEAVKYKIMWYRDTGYTEPAYANYGTELD